MLDNITLEAIVFTILGFMFGAALITTVMIGKSIIDSKSVKFKFGLAGANLFREENLGMLKNEFNVLSNKLYLYSMGLNFLSNGNFNEIKRYPSNNVNSEISIPTDISTILTAAGSNKKYYFLSRNKDFLKVTDLIILAKYNMSLIVMRFKADVIVPQMKEDHIVSNGSIRLTFKDARYLNSSLGLTDIKTMNIMNPDEMPLVFDKPNIDNITLAVKTVEGNRLYYEIIVPAVNDVNGNYQEKVDVVVDLDPKTLNVIHDLNKYDKDQCIHVIGGKEICI